IVVFFLLSSSWVTEGSLLISLPSATTNDRPASADTAIVIEVLADGRYQVAGVAVGADANALREAIVRASNGDVTRAVLFRADGEAKHRDVVRAIDVIRQLGFGSVDMATRNVGGMR
ncbi:MAG: ExbD/TolR family protein, partial [Steroidobacteraceae bacterium]